MKTTFLGDSAGGDHEHGRAGVDRAAAPRRELHCRRCGYGISVTAGPQRCPMCGAESGWRPGATGKPGPRPASPPM